MEENKVTKASRGQADQSKAWKCDYEDDLSRFCPLLAQCVCI